MKHVGATVAASASHETHATSWGELVWMVSASRANSATMTFGRCLIHPHRENPLHYHPNCDEILYVSEGTIEHTSGGDAFAMRAGDAISIPAGVVHNARNVGEEDAVLLIAFSSADRETVPVDRSDGKLVRHA